MGQLVIGVNKTMEAGDNGQCNGERNGGGMGGRNTVLVTYMSLLHRALTIEIELYYFLNFINC